MEIFDPEEQQGKIFDPEVGFIDPYDRDALSTLKRVGKKVYYSGKSMIQGMGLTKDILDIEAGYTPQPPEAAEVPFIGIKDTYIEDKTPKLEKIKEAAKPIAETKKVLEGLEKETPPERRGEVISKPSLLKQPWWYLESIVPSAVGSAGGFAGLNAFTSFFSSLMPSLPGRVVAAGSAAMMETYANMADQYISANEAFLKKGKTPEEAHKLAWKEAQKVGKYEIILDTAFNLVGNKLPKTELTKLKQFISSVKDMFKSEIPQEVGQQLIQNKASMEGHDPGRKWYEGVPESAIGALVGTPFGGFLKYLLGRMKKRGGSTVDTSVLDESVLEEESKPKALPPAVFPMPPSSIYDPEVSEVVSEVTQEEQNLEQFKQIFDPEEVPLVKDYEIVVSGQVQGIGTEPLPETARGYEESQTEEAGKSQVGKKKSTPKPWLEPFTDRKNLKDLRTQKYFRKLNIFKKHLKNPKLWAWLGTKKGDKKAYSPDAPRDEKGYPLVLFHGTAAMGIGGKAVDFPSFDTLKIRSFGTHFGNLPQAHPFADHPFGRILPTILNIKNPLRMQDLGNWHPQRILDELNRLHIILDNETLSAYDNAVQETERMNILWNGLAKKGYDGIVYINRFEGFSKIPLFEDVATLNDEDFKTKYPQAKDSYIIFDPTQAKSIFNQGIFGKDNPDLLYCGFPFTSYIEWIWKKDALKEAKTFYNNIQHGKISFIASPDEVKWFRNRVKKIFTFPATVAEKFPKFRKYFDTARDMLTLQDMLSWDFFDKLTPYLLLENKDNIHKVLEYARLSKGQFNPTDQILQKAGLSQEEIDAYRSVESAMDFGWRLLKASFMEKAKYIKDPVEKKAYINKINGLIDARKRENYVPFSRFGDFYVLVKDSNGKIINYSYYESKNDMKKVANDFVKKGYTVETGEVLKKAEEYRNVRNRSILDALADVDNDMLELGFTKHLLRSEDVPGYSSDLKRSILDYILSVSRFVARRKAAYEFDSYTDSIDPKKESGLYNYANRYAQYVLSNDSEAVKFREFMFYYYLGFNAKSALVNLTQTLTTTVPVLSKYFKVPEAHIPLYIKQASEYLLNPDRFARKNHELYQAITFGVKHGKIAENMARFLRGEEQGTNEKITTFKEMAAWMFDKAEVFNRTVALIAGYDVGKRQGMTPNEALVFAERFVDETQFDYSKVNRPEIARSWRAPLFTFRMFLGNYLSLLKKSMQEKEWEVLARMLGYMTALGGLFAIPGIKELDKILTTLGVDTKLTLRKTFGKFSEVVLHGLPTLFGANISGTIGVGELAPEIEEGLAPAIGRAIGGVALDLPTRVGRALWLYRDKDSPYRAIEALMPEAVRNPMVAARWASEGVRSPSYENVVPKEEITTTDVVLKSLALTPSRVSKAYELENTEKFMVDKIRKRNSKANWSVAKALYEDMQNNTNTVQDILDQIDEHNNKAEKIEDFIRLDPTAIKDYVTLMISPQSVEIKKMPKVGRPGYLERQELYQ